MNQPLVESIAQAILAMSDEERQLLETLLQRAKTSPQMNESPENKSFRVAEIARDIQDFEEKYYYDTVGTSTHEPQNHTGQNDSEKSVDQGDTAYSFFKLAQSLNLEGPKDWSINVDHYLYGLPKVQDD